MHSEALRYNDSDSAPVENILSNIWSRHQTIIRTSHELGYHRGNYPRAPPNTIPSTPVLGR